MSEFFAVQLSEIEAKIAPIQAQLEPLIKQRDELKILIQELGESTIADTRIQTNINEFVPAPSEYDSTWSALQKTVYFTKTHGFLTLSQVADLIMKYEPSRDINALKNNLSVSFSQDVSKVSDGKNILIRRKNYDNKWEYKAK